MAQNLKQQIRIQSKNFLVPNCIVLMLRTHWKEKGYLLLAQERKCIQIPCLKDLYKEEFQMPFCTYLRQGKQNADSQRPNALNVQKQRQYDTKIHNLLIYNMLLKEWHFLKSDTVKDDLSLQPWQICYHSHHTGSISYRFPLCILNSSLCDQN